MASSLLALKRRLISMSPKSLPPTSRLFSNKTFKEGLRRLPTDRHVVFPCHTYENEEGFHIREDMPGVGKEDVNVSVNKNILTITGNREDKNLATITLTRNLDMAAEKKMDGRTVEYGSSFILPDEHSDDYDLNRVKAVIINGVLNVLVPAKVKGPKED